ncbi:hypothetical protein GUITHDRAFT_154337 [Guillardia theta CCMP2712]|uniref:GMP phosphodiesterase delta subunit domain-containing protein n=1 Tax=Guillardia theta (strain CCMP2712) TaxID=905079 RepID=L1ITV1_GUITC|nr:hypothetical protein GUITHDRAFT_154337 [Guillardia theta CCMP2712]EKX39668.1 hypothetical protein GUITHDRAFT_154337 [Guillardia theta CCMP2712]|mmetsp:Transcript_2565/g.8463  ORF Transcript_2565/g.8463 Transcript_2565/m.8463 type:complete len:158 (-) Transcript_2565:819-1292(-)|eukprot:XP_005826648.1 hypothetical protein GUITHDRAFT_154337 [Guillardia theta CCMP2712]
MGEQGEVYISSNPEDAKVVEGFRLEHMNMRDADSGQILWESPADWEGKFFFQELEAHVPREILACKSVSREVRFSSVEKMDDFKLLQKIYFQGSCFEEWFFKFGFVMPNSTNSWQSTIEAAPEMLPAEILSGNVTIESNFFDGERLLAKSLIRVFYE